MIYRVIGLMSGSSLDGLDVVFAELEETGGKWSYIIKAADCYEYDEQWQHALQHATTLNAYDYLLLHTAYGHYIAEKVSEFIEQHHLHHKVQLIASHGHTTFHTPQKKMTAQLGDGASIAAITGINTVSDLRAMDIALGGEGAPIVPVGEKLLLSDYNCFLNIGGIANISFHQNNSYTAYDVCPANRILNMLAQQQSKPYDKDGNMAASGSINKQLLNALNALEYYNQPYPKSLANSFGTEVIYPLIQSYSISAADALATYAEHIALQVSNALSQQNDIRLLITGGGAFNTFLVQLIQQHTTKNNIEVVVPDAQLVQYKEALIMALLGVLRWREENTVTHTATGASRSSIGGAVWIGQDA